MAIHVTCSRAGAASREGGAIPVEKAVLLWSETLSSPGVTTNKVPDAGTVDTAFTGTVLSVLAMDAPAWVAISPGVPNAGVNPRRYIPQNVPFNFAAAPGDKVAFAAVS